MDFEQYWQLIGGDVNFSDRKQAAEKAWNLCAPEKRNAILDWLQKHGRYPGRNPYFFILDFQMRRRVTLSYNDYYKRYGTTEPCDGWQMVTPKNPGDPPLHYVKNA